MQPVGNFDEQQVAGGVAVFVVERFEVVEVEEEHGAVGAATLALCHRLGEAVAQQAPIGQAGQRVVEGQFAHPVLHFAAFRDVAADPTVAHDPAFMVTLGRGQDLHPDS